MVKSYLRFSFSRIWKNKCLSFVARAIANFKTIFSKMNCYLFIVVENHSTFFSLTSVSPFWYSTTQLTESPISISRNCLTSLGMVVLEDLLFGRANDTFVAYSNTFIPPVLFFIVYYMVCCLYIIFLFVGRNIYLLQSLIIN